MKLTLFEVWKYKAMFLLEYKLSVTIKWQTYIQEDAGYFGFDLRARTDKKILVLKSRGHFRAAYEPFSKLILEVDAPGLTTPNLEWFIYHNMPRPIWPFDEQA